MSRLGCLLASMSASLLPASAWACAVCGQTDDPNRAAFLQTTIFMSLLPLSLIGGGAYWLWRQYRLPSRA